MADIIHSVLRASHIYMGFVGLAMFWVPALTRKGGRVHVVAGKVFAVCAYTVALTALGSSAWVLIHPSSWVGEPVVLSEIPIDQIMFISILGLLGIFLLNSIENGVRVVRTRRQPRRSPARGCGRSTGRRRRQASPYSSLVSTTWPWATAPCSRFLRPSAWSASSISSKPKVPRQPAAHPDGLVVLAHGRHGGFGHRLPHRVLRIRGEEHLRRSHHRGHVVVPPLGPPRNNRIARAALLDALLQEEIRGTSREGCGRAGNPDLTPPSLQVRDCHPVLHNRIPVHFSPGRLSKPVLFI